jgi:anaerobic ribonucleoside-triphosphate reductase
MSKKVVTRQRCEVYSRVVGYLSPLSQWNVGKQSEWEDRKVFNLGSK